MEKTFYRRKPKIKTFFQRGVRMRSEAYSDTNAMNWLKEYAEQMNTPARNTVLCEQGDVTGNGVREYRRGSRFFSVAEGNRFRKIESDSVLNPLWCGKRLYEVATNGELKINGKGTGVHLGSDLRAWALVKPYGEEQERLVVISRTPRGLGLSFYEYTTELIPVSFFPLDDTFGRSDYLLSVDRHIFCVHNALLDGSVVPLMNVYYWGESVKEVGVGADVPNRECGYLQYVRTPVAVGGDGYVYWIADGGLYRFALGAPRNVEKVLSEGHDTFLSVQWAEGDPYVLLRHKNGDTAFCRIRGTEKEAVTQNARRVYILERDGTTLYYLRERETSWGVEISLVKDEGADVPLTTYRGSFPEGGMFFAGYYLSGVRAVGYQGVTPVAIVKAQEDGHDR